MFYNVILKSFTWYDDIQLPLYPCIRLCGGESESVSNKLLKVAQKFDMNSLFNLVIGKFGEIWASVIFDELQSFNSEN